ncbi:MAG: type II toxin-antitoxin system VapC family toxin [Gracilimonas sp.]|uniref:Type II toxin-antitoxin system VapC family toxin n=1 Tax=Gracilimonas sediminicola TaxID=2952158 RepID=A0A9X2L3D4_9BACT|nr:MULTISPECIES: type II toxin-antitoxin system VapC family toxin [Gracilimonas]MBO6585073.1 type II toxin-antitoxin system VapC family toxin [Gracilimonas sp.]MBO6615656.1 type II toxin-antitoxin system VapC family toxin [Gracilimonas sp.]MCP9291517.1 type II toxin-antitoxin system VapC family toxin [Gracilimonas sediminicola]
MDIVIDTSAVLAVLLNEASRNSILSNSKGMDLIAPISIDAEIGNAISSMFKRNRLVFDEALKVLSQYHLIPIRKTSLDLKESISLSKELNIYAYDAYMLYCCIKYNSPLLSLDTTLLNHAKNKGIKTIEV